MAKRFETFEEAHERALKAVREDLEEALSGDFGSIDGDPWLIVRVYTEAMGYEFEDEEEHPDMYDNPKSRYCRFHDSADRAWRREIKNGAAYKLSLFELIQRCIRAGIIAIGERWPDEKPAAASKRAA